MSRASKPKKAVCVPCAQEMTFQSFEYKKKKKQLIFFFFFFLRTLFFHLFLIFSRFFNAHGVTEKQSKRLNEPTRSPF